MCKLTKEVIIATYTIGSLFINENLNGQLYLDMLKNATTHLNTEALENQLGSDANFVFDETGVHFQHETTPHYVLSV